MRLRFMGWGIGWVMAFLIDCNGGDLVNRYSFQIHRYSGGRPLFDDLI